MPLSPKLFGAQPLLYDYVFGASAVSPVGIVARFCALLVNLGTKQGKGVRSV